MKTDLNQISSQRYAEAMSIMARAIQNMPPAKARELLNKIEKPARKKGA